MKHLYPSAICALLLSVFSVAYSAPMKQLQLADRISELVRKHFPDAVVSQDNGKLSTKNGTMLFTIHRHWMTGEISKETYQVEGPNFKGFIISISVENGKYKGQADVPQTLDRRYWKEYIDCPSTEDGKGHYVINFAYGSRLDRDFINTVFEALSKSKKPTKTSSEP